MTLPLSDIGPLPYSWWNVVLVATQALLVALPAAGLPAFARRYARRSWSLVLPLSITIVVALLAVLPGAAVGLTWLALVATPPLAAAALGWGAHGARPWLAVLAVPALVLAITHEGERLGQGAALFVTALSCVALGRLLVGAVGEVAGAGDGPATGVGSATGGGPATTDGRATGGGPAMGDGPVTGGGSAMGGGRETGSDAAPGGGPATGDGLATSARPVAAAGAPQGHVARSRAGVGRIVDAVPPTAWIRIALVAMAVVDAILVFSGGLAKPNQALNAAVPAADLPRLQFVQFGRASMGYGDVFVAGVLGALLAAEGATRRTQVLAAVATLGLSLVFDLLFALDAVDTLPATVPVAAALLLFGGWRGPVGSGRAGWRPGGRTPGRPGPSVPG